MPTEDDRVSVTGYLSACVVQGPWRSALAGPFLVSGFSPIQMDELWPAVHFLCIVGNICFVGNIRLPILVIAIGKNCLKGS